MKFLCLLNFLFIKVQVSSILKEKKNWGFDLGASALQCITNPYTTEDLLISNGLIWIYIATTPNPNPNPYFVYES